MRQAYLPMHQQNCYIMTIKKLFDRAWAAAENRSWVKGILGKPDGAGGYTVEVTGRTGFVYVRVSTAGSESVTIAKNLGKVANRANLPVKMRLEVGGVYTIFEVDSTYYSAATASDIPNEFGVTAHTHRISTGLEYEIEPERFEPGRVYSYQEFEVWINAFRYHYNGAWRYWEGGLIDITAELPTTSTKWAWVLVGINPGTNTAIAVAGAEVATQAELLLADLDAIAFVNYIPCGAIQCAESDSSATDFTRYYDAHAWFTAHADFNDSEGTSADVTTATPADGTSTYAARRDHAHGIADDAVTNAKLRNSGALAVIGRAANSTGDPADIAATAATDAVLRESGSALGFGTVATGGLANDAVTTAKIANDAVANAKLGNMAEATIKGRKALSGTGDPIDLLLTDSASIQWVWASPADELSAALINDSVTLANLQDIATDRLLGRDTAGTGDVEQLTVGGGIEFTGSGGVQRSALTGDVTASAGNNATTIANDAVTTAKILNDAVATAKILNDAVTNAKLDNMAQATIKGRAAGAGTGDPADLTAAQVRAILGSGLLNVNTTQTGNVGTGEDTLVSYTVAANQLAANGDSLWFEAFGTMAANANNKTVRVRFGASGVNLTYEQANTGWGEHWSIRGRVYRTSSATQKSSVNLISDNDDRVTTQTTTTLDQDLTATVALAVTAEAVSNNDVVIEGLIVGYDPAP
jgi:hypothetical protein